jgi:hypothetical protein
MVGIAGIAKFEGVTTAASIGDGGLTRGNPKGLGTEEGFETRERGLYDRKAMVRVVWSLGYVEFERR